MFASKLRSFALQNVRFAMDLNGFAQTRCAGGMKATQHLLPLTCSLLPSHSAFLHSVRSAMTGSFLAARREGMMPAISVSSTEIAIRISA